jgi:hypothetical protein
VKHGGSERNKIKDCKSLTEMNEELQQALQRCRRLVQECRSRLAANSDLPDGDDASNQERA